MAALLLGCLFIRCPVSWHVSAAPPLPCSYCTEEASSRPESTQPEETSPAEVEMSRQASKDGGDAAAAARVPSETIRGGSSHYDQAANGH